MRRTRNTKVLASRVHRLGAHGWKPDQPSEHWCGRGPTVRYLVTSFPRRYHSQRGFEGFARKQAPSKDQTFSPLVSPSMLEVIGHNASGARARRMSVVLRTARLFSDQQREEIDGIIIGTNRDGS